MLAGHLAERMDVPLERGRRAGTDPPIAPDARPPDAQDADSPPTSQDELEALLDDELAAVDRLLKAE